MITKDMFKSHFLCILVSTKLVSEKLVIKSILIVCVDESIQ